MSLEEVELTVEAVGSGDVWPSPEVEEGVSVEESPLLVWLEVPSVSVDPMVVEGADVEDRSLDVSLGNLGETESSVPLGSLCDGSSNVTCVRVEGVDVQDSDESPDSGDDASVYPASKAETLGDVERASSESDGFAWMVPQLRLSSSGARDGRPRVNIGRRELRLIKSTSQV